MRTHTYMQSHENFLGSYYYFLTDECGMMKTANVNKHLVYGFLILECWYLVASKHLHQQYMDKELDLNINSQAHIS